jgi:hypothetical protein
VLQRLRNLFGFAQYAQHVRTGDLSQMSFELLRVTTIDAPLDPTILGARSPYELLRADKAALSMI